MARTVTTVLICAILAFFLARAVPPAWSWIATMPDPNPSPMLDIENGVFPDDLPGHCRVLRWGKHRGKRHGSFFDDDGIWRIEGQYERGFTRGRWRLLEKGELFLEAVVFAADQPPEQSTVEVYGREVELKFDQRLYWRVAPILCWIPFRLEAITGVRADDAIEIGTTIISWPYAWDSESFLTHRVTLAHDGSATLETKVFTRGHTHLVTHYSPSGEILEQRVYLTSELIERRTARPWFHPLADTDWERAPPALNPGTIRLLEESDE